MKKTAALREVLAALLEEPQGERYGGEVVSATGYASGTVSVILERLAASGYLEDRWEEVDRREVGRAPRRYYRLTEPGEQLARSVLEEWSARRRSPAN